MKPGCVTLQGCDGRDDKISVDVTDDDRYADKRRYGPAAPVAMIARNGVAGTERLVGGII